MKISCECGHTIYDSTDNISYKAYFVADQDYYDLCDAIDEQIEKLAAGIEDSTARELNTASEAQKAMRNARIAISKYARRVIYQCSACGRLFVDDAQFQCQVFTPKDDSIPKNLMRSIEGDKWKRNLRGHWTENHKGSAKGELWWGFGDEEEGYERYDDLETLKNRYFEVFARLQEKGILRDAFLNKGEEMLHQWP